MGYRELMGGGLPRALPQFLRGYLGRIGELGHSLIGPAFLPRHADRILLARTGTRSRPSFIYCPWKPDEYFNYNAAPLPQQGRWHVHGLFLPDEILEKVYFNNAQRILLKNG
jgi:hypothetical protein